MTPEQIQKMAEGCPPSAIGKDHEEVVTWLAEKHIALQEQVQKLAAENAALKDAFHPEAVPDDLLDNFGDAVKMDGETFWEGDNCTSFSYVSNAEELIKLSLASMGGIETPATDAVIREIGAKAVEGLATEFGLIAQASKTNSIAYRTAKSAVFKCVAVAATLRAGEQP